MALRISIPLLLAIALGACGGSSPGGPSPQPAPNPNVITISGGVVNPKTITVAPGSRVLFVNQDSRRHDMTSDDHPDHLECPSINQVGLLNAGQSRETGNMNAVRTCGFHDHEDADNNNLRGSIIVR